MLFLDEWTDTRSQPEHSHCPMRIATWNVESANRLTKIREATFHQAMSEVNADVWVLTETWRSFSPGAGYHLIARSHEAADLEGRPDRCWVSIWAKLSLVAKPMLVHSQPDRMACAWI